jgi:hypothetical protein
MDLRERIDAFVKHVNDLCAKHFSDMKYVHSKPPIHRADYLSDKWCRIVTLEDRGGEYTNGGVYAFVCLKDNTTKALGTVKTGDIHKAAGWSAPAKNARGSVYDNEFKWATPNGIANMRR